MALEVNNRREITYDSLLQAELKEPHTSWGTRLFCTNSDEDHLVLKQIYRRLPQINVANGFEQAIQDRKKLDLRYRQIKRKVKFGGGNQQIHSLLDQINRIRIASDRVFDLLYDLFYGRFLSEIDPKRSGIRDVDPETGDVVGEPREGFYVLNLKYSQVENCLRKLHDFETEIDQIPENIRQMHQINPVNFKTNIRIAERDLTLRRDRLRNIAQALPAKIQAFEQAWRQRRNDGEIPSLMNRLECIRVDLSQIDGELYTDLHLGRSQEQFNDHWTELIMEKGRFQNCLDRCTGGGDLLLEPRITPGDIGKAGLCAFTAGVISSLVGKYFPAAIFLENVPLMFLSAGALGFCWYNHSRGGIVTEIVGGE